MSEKAKRTVYPLLGAWLCLVLVGLAYVKVRGEDGPAVRADTPRQLADEQARVDVEAQVRRSEAKAVGAVKGKAVVGKRAPAFKLTGAGGRRVSLAKLRGKPVVVEFFASWCPHCRAMSPVFAKVMRDRTDVRFVMVAAAREDHGDVIAWHHDFLERRMPGKLAFDDGLDVARAYGVEGYPTTAFVDADGVLVAKTSGEMTEAQLRAQVTAIADR